MKWIYVQNNVLWVFEGVRKKSRWPPACMFRYRDQFKKKKLLIF